MPRLKKISGRKCIKILCNKFGFMVVRKRGSHVVLRKGSAITVVPNHKELKTGTLKGVLQLANVNEDEFSEQQ